MRIRDWSSDVCSSDLAAEATRKEAKRGGRRAKAKLRAVEEAMAPHVEAAAARAQGFAETARDRAGEVSDKAREQIGGAACRERGWQGVSISVVPVSLTKK